MLECMTIDNIALIGHAEIEFSDGFNVLTGETGAGKSILVGSINMLLGERVSKDLIRFGERRAMVQGLFRISDPRVLSYLEENGLEAEEDGGLILSRELLAEGKNICRVGGRMVPVAKLRELGRWLMNIHGQHDNQALLDKTTHLGFLDRFAGEKIRGPLTEYRALYRELTALGKELTALDMDDAEKLRRMDILQYEINELEAAELKPGEKEELKQKATIANNAKKLLALAGQALDLMYENADGECAYNLLASASQLLGNASEIDPAFAEAADGLESALVAVEDTARQVQSYLDSFELDGSALEMMEERLDLIYRLERKYGGSVEGALQHLEACREEYSRIELMDERRQELEKRQKEILSKTVELAKCLSALRRESAARLSGQIGENLAFLNMPDAAFLAEITPCEPGADGADLVEFMLSANRGEPPKPLAKIVSGGELSRIMLAIKSILADSDVVGTLIFDEVDSGVSGRAAQKLGEKLKELSRRKQVLCVTHLAQVAAMAQRHFLIEKHEADSKTVTSVAALSREGRIQELARIIGGEHITETTKRQAEEMLDD